MNFLTRISSKNIYKLSNHILQDSKYLCYKSSISLDKLYPNSNLTITTPKLVRFLSLQFKFKNI